MQFKTILNSLFIAYLCSSAYASSSKDSCKELQEYFNGKTSRIENCKNDSNGNIDELKFSSDDLTAEDYKKIFSYDTIKKLDYYDEYSDCSGLNNGISNLKNLEDLKITSFRGNVAANVLKDLKSLKSFTYDSGDYNSSSLTQDNINEIANLPNLDKLSLAYVGVYEDKLDFSPLKNSKITSLYLSTNGKAGINHKELVNNLKNLKELNIQEFDSRQGEVDAITSSSKLEKLTITLEKDIKTDNFKNLKNLTYLDLTMDDLNEVPQFVYTIPNLKTLKFNGKDIPLNNAGANGATDATGADGANGANGANDVPGAAGNSTVGAAGNSTLANGSPNVENTSGSSTIIVRSFSYLSLAIIYLLF